MSKCLTCLEEAPGQKIVHSSGQEFFFCTEHFPAAISCYLCKVAIPFGDECSSDGHDICFGCWKNNYPENRYEGDWEAVLLAASKKAREKKQAIAGLSSAGHPTALHTKESQPVDVDRGLGVPSPP